MRTFLQGYKYDIMIYSLSKLSFVITNKLGKKYKIIYLDYNLYKHIYLVIVLELLLL